MNNPQNSTTRTVHNTKLPTPEVLAMGDIAIVGNVIPHTWFQALKLESGKPNLPAIVVLSEICYWYRPRFIKDERTGAVIGIEKKFSSDKLQRSYSSFSTFGLTKKQAYDACHYLDDKGLITLETRTITVSGGQKISNVLFIGIVPKAIAEISSPSSVVPDSKDTTTETTTKMTTNRLLGCDAASSQGNSKKVKAVKAVKAEVPTEITAKIYEVCKLVAADCPVGVCSQVANTGAWLVKKYPQESTETLCSALDEFAQWFTTVHWKGRWPQPQVIPTYWQQAVDYAAAEQAKHSQDNRGAA
jgi:hypothetical protein